MNILLLALNAKYIHSSLALRSIKSYCHEYEKNISLLEMSINHNENEIIREIYKRSPDILGISCYIWNMHFIKELIPTLKKILPHTLIVLGGPEVSYHSEGLFKELPIDIVMEGEGEQTWKEFLDYQYKKALNIEDIEGIVYKDNEKIIRNKPRSPLDLDKLPFVYEDMSDLQNKIIYYEASRGCPFNCQYCLSSKEKGVRFASLGRVKEHLKFFLNNKVKQVKFVDRTFNAKKNFALEIWHYLIENDNGYTNFHFEMAAELIDDEILNELKNARKGLFQFEIGIQSTNREVLRTIQRFMPFENMYEVITKIKDLGTIHQHLDLIAGLPLENYASFRNSFNEVIRARPDQLQLGFLKLLKGSGLRENAKKYGIVYKEEAPYEVLFTKDITYGEMLKLHGIEEMLERYYNSERFNNILEYLFTLCKTEFDFFEQLWFYWEKMGYDQMQHNKISYYIKLQEFACTLENVEVELVKELIKLDLYFHEYIKEMPKELNALDQSQYREEAKNLLKDDELIKKVSKRLFNLDTRHRFRKAHIEFFSYDVLRAWQQKSWRDIKRYRNPSPVLFDYTLPDIQCTLLSKE